MIVKFLLLLFEIAYIDIYIYVMATDIMTIFKTPNKGYIFSKIFIMQSNLSEKPSVDIKQ